MVYCVYRHINLEGVSREVMVLMMGTHLPKAAPTVGRRWPYPPFRPITPKGEPLMDSSVIRSIPLFSGIDPGAADELSAAMGRKRLRRGEVLFREGEPGDRFYIILHGKMKMGRAAIDGRENLLALLGPGEMIGELTLFDPGARTATAIAVGDAELAVLSHGDLIGWIEKNPHVTRVLLAALARRLRRTNESLADLVFSDVPGRVAKALLDLARRFGELREGMLYVPHDLTQEELAQLVGASRETVNKALADFGARGWIRLEGKGVFLLDVERLERRTR